MDGFKFFLLVVCCYPFIMYFKIEYKSFSFHSIVIWCVCLHKKYSNITKCLRRWYLMDFYFVLHLVFGWNVEWIKIYYCDDFDETGPKWNDQTKHLNGVCLSMNDKWTINERFMLINRWQISQNFDFKLKHWTTLWKMKIYTFDKQECLTMTKSHNGILNILKNRQNNKQQ